MNFCLPSPVLFALRKLNDAGYEAYVVGGCVRDALMGKDPYDWDITTSALPEQTLDVFKGNKTILTGIKHGTVTVIVEETPLEITTYRVDGDYSDGRHPSTVYFTRSLIEDLQRRDFTVNAMAYHPAVGLIDHFGGQNDLISKTIRCVGDPQTRFAEDALRIMRALRFAATLSFSIEPTTAQSIHSLHTTLNLVAAERISSEFVKLLCGKDASAVLSAYPDVLTVILSPFTISTVNVKWLDKIVPSPLSRLTMLLFGAKIDTVRSILQSKLRLSNQLTDDVCAILAFANVSIPKSDEDTLRLLGQLGDLRTKKLIAIRSVTDNADYSEQQKRIDHLLRAGACYSVSQLAINGDDLISLGVTPGPSIGEALNTLLGAVITGQCVNSKDMLTEYFKRKPVR